MLALDGYRPSCYSSNIVTVTSAYYSTYRQLLDADSHSPVVPPKMSVPDTFGLQLAKVIQSFFLSSLFIMSLIVELLKYTNGEVEPMTILSLLTTLQSRCISGPGKLCFLSLIITLMYDQIYDYFVTFSSEVRQISYPYLRPQC